MRKQLLILSALTFSGFTAGAQTILGIDVSHYQGSINWTQVKTLASKVFAYAKATEGTSITDSNFTTYMANGYGAGVIMGAYHFADPENNSAVNEANYFLGVAAPYIKSGYLPPVLDLEDPPSGPPLSIFFTSAQLTTWVQTWMTTVQNATGVTPILYTNGTYAAYLNSSLNVYGLWMADPDGNPSTPPASIGVWTTWKFKQYSWTGSVSGIVGDVDLDVFNGDMSAFNTLINSVVPNPVTSITMPPGWITKNFTTGFTDKDTTGIGIATRFYQAGDYNGSQWHANSSNGFTYDNFDSAGIYPNWKIVTGIWKDSSSAALEQMDQSQGNTNIYTPLTQNLSNVYLYNWMGMINGSGINRRAGFHFFVDNPDSSNRNNSYFVWFRVDDKEFQLYKVVNNNYGTPVVNIPFTINPGTWYEYTVIYDRITGTIKTFVNQKLINTYIDPTPYSNGAYISFRSGNSAYWVKNLRVYRSRTTTVTVSVGTPASDIRYQNPNSKTQAGFVHSIILDSADVLSPYASVHFDVDWTCPSNVSIVNDGTGIDIDTDYSTSQLSGNWTTAIDPNSSVASYSYAVGITPGDSSIVPWTNNNLTTVFTKTGLSLITGEKYYVSVKAYDSAGLHTSVFSSDGQVVEMPSAVRQINAHEISVKIYPNPNNGDFNVDLSGITKAQLALYDVLGQQVYQAAINPGVNKVNISVKKAGVYFFRVVTETADKVLSQGKLIVR